MTNEDTNSNRDEKNNAKIDIMGHASVALSETVGVEAIYDENGDLDKQATLAQMDDQDKVEALINALVQHDPDATMKALTENTEVDNAEIKEVVY